MKQKLLCAAFALLGTNAFAQNLIAHWDFDGPSVNMTPGPGTAGTVTENIHGWVGTLYSMNGGAHHIAGDPAGGPGNKAIWFAPTSWLQVPHDPIMDIQSWTIRVVFKNYDCASTTNPTYCQTGVVISRGIPGSDGHYGVTFGDDPADNNCNTVSCARSVFMAQAAGTEMVSQNTTYATQAWLGYPGPLQQPNLLYGNQQWNCLVASYNASTREIALSINGTEYVRKTWANTNQYSTSPTPGDIFIGNSHLAVPGSGNIFNQINAAIDDIKIWNGVFTNPADIAALCGCQRPNLVARWDFDNGNTTELIHGWQNISPAAPTQQVADMNGIPNGAMKFNSGDYLQYFHDAVMDLSSWTIAARVRPDVYNNGICETSIVLQKGANYDNNTMGMMFFDNAFDNTCGQLGKNPDKSCFVGLAAGNMPGTAAQWLAPTPNINPFINWGQWYCVVATYDATASTPSVNIYIDGTHVATAPWSNQYGGPMNASDLFIGSSTNPGSIYSYFFDGAIDDIQIYDGAFCPGEVPTLCCTEPTPVARWNFQNNSTQESINGWTDINNPVLGLPVVGFDGNANEAIHLNRGQYLQFPHDPAMDLTSWTITAIVKPDSWDPNQFCQGTAILSKGAQYANNSYGMVIFDNVYDQTCYTYSPNNMLFTGYAAGNTTASPGNWYGGPGNPNGPLETNPDIVLGEWYCVAITYDGVAGRIMAYVEGEQVASVNWPNQYANPMTPADLFIGSSDNPNGSYPYFFEGDIDEIRLYRGALCHSRLPICGREDRGQFLKPSNVNDIVSGKVEIVPNPANSVVTITVPQGWSNVPYTLTNSVGARIQSGQLNGKTTIDVSYLAPGLYMVTTEYKGQSTVQKLVIQH